MKKEDLIIKWLDNDLDERELQAFEQLDAFSDFLKIDKGLKNLETPPFNVELALERLKSNLPQHKKQSSWTKYIGSIAALLVIALCVYFTVFSTTETSFLAKNTETIEFSLPDTSQVILNSGSHISFDEKHWANSREVTLQGEAYFKVAKGAAFTVQTERGKVTVLGTQFSVNARANYFEIICFEGLVQVAFEDKLLKLQAGNMVSFYNDKELNQETVSIEPAWLHSKSIFKSVPVGQVLDELERQYNITFINNNVSSIESTLFTGSFTHENLETALQAITIPLNLSYQINGTKVVLKPN